MFKEVQNIQWRQCYKSEGESNMKAVWRNMYMRRCIVSYVIFRILIFILEQQKAFESFIFGGESSVGGEEVS